MDAGVRGSRAWITTGSVFGVGWQSLRSNAPRATCLHTCFQPLAMLRTSYHPSPNLPYGIPIRLVSRFIAIAAAKAAGTEPIDLAEQPNGCRLPYEPDR